MPMVVALVFVGALVLTGCDSNEDAPVDQIEGIAIAPDTVSIGIGEQREFTVV